MKFLVKIDMHNYIKPNAYVDKHMTYKSTSESKYHFYWANDQYNHDYDTGFNLLEKATR
jgi:hypothetical protein